MFQQIKQKNPLVHCITNHVVSNFQANGLLAIGASPIMGEAPEEVEELAGLAQAVSLNIGTLHAESLKSMLIAGKKANQLGIPVVLDPVGAGASNFRIHAVREILETVDVSVLRCNAGELAAVVGKEWQFKGVDAGEGLLDVKELAMSTAKQLGLIVAVTGKIDCVTDGDCVDEIPFGSPIMASITGTGCLLSSVVAAGLAVDSENPLETVSAILRYFAIAGELASQSVSLPGDFQLAFMNRLASLTDGEVAEQIYLQERVL
ncbi:hydroxyethylthiazole kinase [Planococcus faecalis]|uniref:Hydroxyethylthiazole kinase n=1 Tax=Planococcus faecalis TaxID=1598147 RepID=A0ABN4XS12_9BACL|nr:hydroxyethylthiazole kinase [Planococcus faecalis]AQU80623.1 hydroxyethylthiazole kinase [Planococcus faecalis]OHX55625.1 hydroxyethylthiazole kinase [Planococcus faecalis]